MTRKSDVPAPSAVDAFLEKAKEHRPPDVLREGRLLFALDATASRQPTWDLASDLQARMFDAAGSVGGLVLKLCWFRGFGEFHQTGWERDSRRLREQMLAVRCAAGATQIERVLELATAESRKSKLHALVLIGDCLEEEPDRICAQAGQLALLGTPVFAFQEGDDAVAGRWFREMAQITRGAFRRLQPGAASELEALLRAVSVYAAGGIQALEKHAATQPTARALLEDLR